ncbi:hypothetical protein SISSUDRAFT_1066867 [Sistotremastrum suecicum HHB10207 ss-3]|uniref:F-box domain-containing protein n=1 Tax=Sistotremastrum suecicum HHB10207 ss-3 TaxID=1314776 RepID=A0A165XT71_9AGAM|nr:hypothetical protein SISSUDRAFT_1066867 [Sistotremastrum suecicum HHB10207 ss-3]
MEPYAESGGLMFVRPLEQSDWTRFLKYAAFVKEIHITQSSPRWKQFASETFFAMDATCPVDTIFPNLEFFEAAWPLGPSKYLYPMIFQKRLRTLCSIRKLNIQGAPKVMDPLTHKELMALIPELKSLVNLDVPSIFVNSEIFEMLSSKEHLESLVMNHTPLDVTTVQRYPFCFVEGHFPCLKDIAMVDYSDCPHEQVVVTMPNTTLRTVYGTLCGVIELSNMRKYYSILTEAFPSLRFVSLRIKKAFQDADQFLNSASAFSMIRPLLSLKKLRHFSISGESRICLADEHIEQMTRAWNHLRVFNMSCRTPHRKSELELTLSSLISFAENCPFIEYILLAVDASIDPPRPLTDRLSFPNSFYLLDLSGSLAGDTGAVACFIADLLPTGDGWMFFCQTTERELDTDPMREEKWNEVRDLVVNILKVRARGVRRALSLASSEDS